MEESESSISYSLSGTHRHTEQPLYVQLLLKPDCSTELQTNCKNATGWLAHMKLTVLTGSCTPMILFVQRAKAFPAATEL